MKLIVENLGALKRAEVDLSKKIYVFLGYNNAGKTYLSKLIYNIFDSKTARDFATSVKLDNFFSNELQNTQTDFELTNDIVDYILQEFSTYLCEVAIPKSLKISKNNSLIKGIKIKFTYNEKELTEPALKASFGIGILNTQDSDKNEITVIQLNKKEHSRNAKIEYIEKDDIYKKLPKDFFDHIPKRYFEEQIFSIKNNVSKELTGSILNLLLQNKEKPFFLPANRIFILENANEFIQQDNARKTELAEMLMEFIETKNAKKEKITELLARKSESNHTSEIANLINEIAKLRSNKDEHFIKQGTRFYEEMLSSMSNIMGGEIVLQKISEESNLIEKFKINNSKSSEEAINLYLASSSVNQLGILFLFFKYWARLERNFLMIDEPEISLHPENQAKIVGVLLDFVSKNNNKLLITTHSPLVADVINNYLYLTSLKSNYGYSQEEINRVITKNELHYLNPSIDINKQDMAVYFFNGKTLINYYDNYDGIYFDNFRFIVNNINKNNNDLIRLINQNNNNK